jgi:hypothetical protein
MAFCYVAHTLHIHTERCGVNKTDLEMGRSHDRSTADLAARQERRLWSFTCVNTEFNSAVLLTAPQYIMNDDTPNVYTANEQQRQRTVRVKVRLKTKT